MNFFRSSSFLILIVGIMSIISPALYAQTDTPESAAGETNAVPTESAITEDETRPETAASATETAPEEMPETQSGTSSEPATAAADSSPADETRPESAASATETAPEKMPETQTGASSEPAADTEKQASAPAAPKTMSVQVNRANVRDNASLSAKINAQLKKGQAVTVLEVKDDWYHIQLEDGEDGWAHESLFSGKKNEKAVSAGDSIPIRVSAGNIRRDPEIGSDILTVLKKGENITVLETGEEWYRVQIADGTEGWAHKKLFAKSPPKNYPLGGIRIESIGKKEEKVYFIYKGPEPPTVFITQADSTRIVCDFSDTRPDRTIQQKTEVRGNLIQTVRLGLHGEDQRDARIVLDMASDVNYQLEHFFVKGELYVLIIRKTA